MCLQEGRRRHGKNGQTLDSDAGEVDRIEWGFDESLGRRRRMAGWRSMGSNMESESERSVHT